MRSAKKEGAFRVNFMSSENPLLYWVLVAGLCIHVQKKTDPQKKSGSVTTNLIFSIELLTCV